MAPVAPIERSSILILHGRYPHVENRTSGPFHGTPEDAIQHIFGATMGLAELQARRCNGNFSQVSNLMTTSLFRLQSVDRIPFAKCGLFRRVQWSEDSPFHRRSRRGCAFRADPAVCADPDSNSA